MKRKTRSLGSVGELGSDMLIAARWMREDSRQYCSRGTQLPVLGRRPSLTWNGLERRWVRPFGESKYEYT